MDNLNDRDWGIYNEGYLIGWDEGREALAASLLDYLRVACEYHTEIEPLVKELEKFLEEELGHPYEEEEYVSSPLTYEDIEVFLEDLFREDDEESEEEDNDPERF